MSISRRSLFGALAGAAGAAALPAPLKAEPVTIPDDYEVDFELLTPFGELHYDVHDVSAAGFELEISVRNMSDVTEEGWPKWQPYTGKIKWWAMPDLEAPPERAYASGVAQAVLEETDYSDGRGVVRVRFQ